MRDEVMPTHKPHTSVVTKRELFTAGTSRDTDRLKATPVSTMRGCTRTRSALPWLCWLLLPNGTTARRRPFAPPAPPQVPPPPPPLASASTNEQLYIGTHSQAFDILPPSQCARCAAPHSLIVLESQAVYGFGDGAGLTDRSLMLASVSNLAASLCAHLEVRPPCWTLGSVHNAGRSLNCTIGWDRYLRVAYLADDSDVLVPEGSSAGWAERDPSHAFTAINNLTAPEMRDAASELEQSSLFIHNGGDTRG